MTLSEEFITYEDRDEVAAPNYPTAFGVTFTPTISGIALAVAGLAASVYLFLNLVSPALQRNQELRGSENQKQSLVAQKATALQQMQQVETESARAKQQKAEVLSVFANEQTLDTLLIDLNRLIQSANSQQRTTAKLRKFVPANQTAEVISDSSLGAEVNGKLKRRAVNIEFVGTFEQTQAILRNIERLQPLLIVKDYQSTMAAETTDDKDKPVGGPPIITTSFQLQALIPASPTEASPPTEAAGAQK
jgi:type IV pilus assembly protein PilO